VNPKSGKAGSAVGPAGPQKAEEADKAEPGEVAKTKAEQLKTKKGKYGSDKVPPYKPSEDKTSWIEVELVDKQGNPVPGARYEITLPDGKTLAAGTLDKKGYVKISGIDAGQCKIAFPELDADNWIRKS